MTGFLFYDIMVETGERMKKLTKLEKELLDTLESLIFYMGHSDRCDKIYRHNPNLKCTCPQGKALIKAKILGNKFGSGGHRIDEVDL